MKSIHHRNVINTHVISNKSNLIKQKHSTLSVSQIKQTKRKYTESLINTINEDLTDKYHYSNNKEHNLFSNLHGILINIDHKESIIKIRF